MRTLTENDLKMYLGTNTKCQCWNGGKWEDRPLNTKVLHWYGAAQIKPILYPLSCLTKPICFEGEIFTPLERLRLENVPNIDYNEQLGLYLESSFGGKLSFLQMSLIHNELYKWRIDALNLIGQDLAIPVTEEFNPYK